MSSTPASISGWLPTMPTGWPSTRLKPQTMLFAQCGKYSKNSPSSTTSRMTFFMSYGWFGAGGQEVVERRAQPVGVVAGVDVRRLLEVVRRQEAEQEAHVVEAGLLVGRHERGDTALGGVAHRPAELLERDLLAGDRLHHVGAGDEHVAGLADHEDEVGHRRAVHGTAGARPEDHRDLRHDAAATARCGRRCRRSWRARRRPPGCGRRRRR